jgi:predicted DNA-binding transcriptional regulator AlpA
MDAAQARRALAGPLDAGRSAQREQVDPADLIGAGEILKLVGWKTRKSLLDAQKTRDFPPPVVVVRGARLWRREDIERWIALRDCTTP